MAESFALAAIVGIVSVYKVVSAKRDISDCVDAYYLDKARSPAGAPQALFTACMQAKFPDIFADAEKRFNPPTAPPGAAPSR